MMDEDVRLMKFFEREFYKNSTPEKVFFVPQYWEDRAAKELAEPSVFDSLDQYPEA